MEKVRVVVTGLGIVSPLGNERTGFWRALCDGRSGTSRVTAFDVSRYQSQVAGIIHGLEPEVALSRDLAKRTDRFVHLGLISAQEAIVDSGIEHALLRGPRTGTIYGSGLGGILFHEEQMLKGFERGTHRLNPLCVPRITPNALASHIALHVGALGPSFVISNACVSGTNAVGEAFRKIQYGELDVAICGGAEAPLTEFTFGAYDALKVLSQKNETPEAASTPFDATRNGFVIAEAGATLILEALPHALSRGARIYAEILGYAANSGAYHMVIPKPEGDDIVAVMRAAFADARRPISDVSYINAHGTGTLPNDAVETLAIKQILGDNAARVPVSSTKSSLGHSIGAAGAVEALICCLSVSDSMIPPTINLKHADPACDLDYVPHVARACPVAVALSNSFGFGSNNASLVIGRYDEHHV